MPPAVQQLWRLQLSTLHEKVMFKAATGNPVNPTENNSAVFKVGMQLITILVIDYSNN